MVVKLTTVAEKAGVSVASVSRAVSGKPGVGDRTRQRILKIASGLGFEPNIYAKALASGRTDTLGLILREMAYVSSPYMGAIIGGLAQMCDENRQSLVFASSTPNGSGEAPYMRAVNEGRVDGMVVVDLAMTDQELDVLRRRKLPMVVVDRQLHREKYPVVRINYRDAVRQATSSLIELGHRRIAVYPYYSHLQNLNEQAAGYTEAMKDHGLPLDRKLLLRINIDTLGALDPVEAALIKLARSADPPTAYLILIDWQFLPICERLRRNGLRIPQDVSVVGIGSDVAVKSGTSSMSLVSVPGFETGRQAGQMLLDLICGKQTEPERVLDARFIAGYTSGPVHG